MEGHDSCHWNGILLPSKAPQNAVLTKGQIFILDDEVHFSLSKVVYGNQEG